jgi:hypothetical protein
MEASLMVALGSEARLSEVAGTQQGMCCRPGVVVLLLWGQ